MSQLAGRLSFFTELDAHQLTVIDAACLEWLARMKASVTMALRDLKPERAAMIRELRARGVPVTAWLLVPREEGYFATFDNVAAMERKLEAFIAWNKAERLGLATIGFDFEPDLREVELLSKEPLRQLARWALRSRDVNRYERARAGYSALIAKAHEKHLRVEAYQFPFLVDDRRARGSAAQRFVSSLDVPVDEEVFMLYTSLMGPFAYGLLESYAPECASFGIGSTGGGIDDLPKLTWEQLERDVRLALFHAPRVRIFSLEGCLQHGSLERLEAMTLTAPLEASASARRMASLTRAAVRAFSRMW